MRALAYWVFGSVGGLSVLAGCSATSEASDECVRGTEACECADGACNDGLECSSDLCVASAAGSGANGGSTSMPGGISGAPDGSGANPNGEGGASGTPDGGGANTAGEGGDPDTPPSYEGQWRGYTDEEFTQSVRFDVINDNQIINFISARDFVHSDGGCQVDLAGTTPSEVVDGQASLSIDLGEDRAEISLTFDTVNSLVGTISALAVSNSCTPPGATLIAHRFDHQAPSTVPSLAGTHWTGTLHRVVDDEPAGTIELEFSEAYSLTYNDNPGYSWDQNEERVYIKLGSNYSDREFWGVIDGDTMSGVSTFDSSFENVQYSWEATRN